MLEPEMHTEEMSVLIYMTDKQCKRMIQRTRSRANLFK